MKKAVAMVVLTLLIIAIIPFEAFAASYYVYFVPKAGGGWTSGGKALKSNTDGSGSNTNSYMEGGSSLSTRFIRWDTGAVASSTYTLKSGKKVTIAFTTGKGVKGKYYEADFKTPTNSTDNYWVEGSFSVN